MNEKKLPLVSIITPVYNGAKYLNELITSVRDQDYPNVEHIIIDDGSTDRGATVEVLKAFPHLRWWSRENRGQYATINEGLEAARGELFCIVCADDIMGIGAISSIVDFLTKNPKCDGVYGYYGWIDENSALYWYQPLVRHAPLRLFCYFPFFAHCSFYLRKEKLLSNKLYFDTSLSFNSDYDWIIRIIKAGFEIGYVSQPLSLVRRHMQQRSVTEITSINIERAQVWKKYGVNPFLFKVINVGIDRLQMTLRSLTSSFNRDKSREIQTWLANHKG